MSFRTKLLVSFAAASWVMDSFWPNEAALKPKLAELPPFESAALRMATLALALAGWIAVTMRYAARNRVPVSAVVTADQARITSRQAMALIASLALAMSF